MSARRKSAASTPESVEEVPRTTVAQAGAKREAEAFVGSPKVIGNTLEGSGLYGLLVESVQDYAIFALDPKGYILSWNIGAARLKGYKADEIIGQHFSIFYPAEDR